MTSKGRVKRPVIKEVITVEKAGKIFAEYAEAHAKVNKINADIDVKVNQIRTKYQEELLDLNESMKKNADLLEHFAKTNPELFEKRRTLEFAHGKLGFRLGQWKAVNLFKKWDDVLVKLKDKLPDFVRVKEEVDKQGLIDNRENEEIASLYPLCGVSIEQDETWFIEPKTEEVTA